MKPAVLVLLVLASAVWSEEDAKSDATKLLNQLMQANAAKDLTTVSTILKEISEIGSTAKTADEVDPFAKELLVTMKLAKGNWGMLSKIVGTLGDLRSSKSIGGLKKIAFKKKAKNEDEEGLQGAAIDAIAKTRDPKLVSGLGDLTKSRSVIVAKAAYACFKHYGPAKGKVRKGIAELLMKRLSAEKPAAGQSGKVSAEQQDRWAKLEKVIVASMQAICRQDTINDIENWREWWKENKKNREVWKDKKADS